MLYKGTLRVLLVLLHDFPEFLCEYHSSFCDCIPTSCIQLRNLILSAFPRNMTLPDPLMPQLKVPANTRQALPLRTYASHSPGLASRTLSQPLSVVAVAVSDWLLLLLSLTGASNLGCHKPARRLAAGRTHGRSKGS